VKARIFAVVDVERDLHTAVAPSLLLMFAVIVSQLVGLKVNPGRLIAV